MYSYDSTTRPRTIYITICKKCAEFITMRTG